MLLIRDQLDVPLFLYVWFSDVPEFRALIGNEAAEELQSAVGDPDRTSLALKKCFTRMMNCEKKLFVDQLNMLVKRISEEGEETCASSLLTCNSIASI